MIGTEKNFWRGYWPLLLALGAAQLLQQADILMIGRLGGAAPGAYLMLTRAAILDVVLMAAMGAVASTTVAQALRNGDPGRTVSQVLGLALLLGLCCAALGFWLYPRVARSIAGEGEVAALMGSGVVWFSLSAPLRFVNSASAFVLHALGRGGLVVRWKLLEVAAKAAGNFLAMEVLGLGFSGCFMTGLIIGIASALWSVRALFPPQARRISVPGYSWAREFLRSTGWEAQRLLTVQLAGFTCLALFAAPWLGKYDVSRLNAFASGQALMVLIFAPFVAMTRFLAIRFAALREDRLPALMQTVWAEGATLAVGAAFLLFLSCDWLGRLYGQHGPWWSIFIQAIAISLPLRFAANVMRALLQSRSAFAAVTTVDNAAFWLIAAPLVAMGLYLDSPLVAYSSLIIPEMACAAWLWRRLEISRRPSLAIASIWPLRLRPLGEPGAGLVENSKAK